MLGYETRYNEEVSVENENDGKQTSDFFKKNLHLLVDLKVAPGW